MAEHPRKLSQDIFRAQGWTSATPERLAMVASESGAFHCHTLSNRQTVRPKKLGPSAAITRIKRHAVRHRIGPLFGTGEKG